MKKTYETPVAEKIEFDYNEVVATSGQGMHNYNVSAPLCNLAVCG